MRGSYIAEDRKKIYFYFVQSLHSLKYCCFFEQSERAMKPTQKLNKRKMKNLVKKIDITDIVIFSGLATILTTMLTALIKY